MTQSKMISVRGVPIGGDSPIVLIAGPCVIEDRDGALRAAQALRDLTAERGVPWIFKASFDKANRSSVDSYRGPGLEKGLEILSRIRKDLEIPITTDVHETWQVDPVSEVVDVIQIPAFLCRQTDLLLKAGRTGKPVNIKKGQFMSPWEMRNAAAKVESVGNAPILLTERGTSFGYNNLVNDFRSLVIMREMGYPVFFDATHSIQRPGGRGATSAGESQFVLPLTRAAAACGVDGLFLEVHHDPSTALCDGPNMVRMDQLGVLLDVVKRIEEALGAQSS